VVERVVAGVEAHGLGCVGVMESPLKGDKAGNTEFLAYFKQGAGKGQL
jgi:23S rRNA (cytidine1920-2'-O)/16S rRNA (cytidine1409-2'-O)-methyltransferase